MSIRSRWLAALVVLVVVFVGVQAVPYGRQRVNPPIGMEPPWDSGDTRALAQRACFDCHSNETHWPAYARVAPVSWLIQHDVDEGRAALNFSEWQRPQEEAGEAAAEIREGEMPPTMYRLMHADASLSDAELERLARGLANTLDRPGGETVRRHESAGAGQ